MMDEATKKALKRLDAAIGHIEARHAEASVVSASVPDADALSPEVVAEIAAIREIVDEAIRLLSDAGKAPEKPVERESK